MLPRRWWPGGAPDHSHSAPDPATPAGPAVAVVFWPRLALSGLSVRACASLLALWRSGCPEARPPAVPSGVDLLEAEAPRPGVHWAQDLRHKRKPR